MRRKPKRPKENTNSNFNKKNPSQKEKQDMSRVAFFSEPIFSENSFALHAEKRDQSGRQTTTKSSPTQTQDKFPIKITQIVPDILRYQFFQEFASDSSDCLLDVCEKLLQKYKKTRKGELLQTFNGSGTNHETGYDYQVSDILPIH